MTGEGEPGDGGARAERRARWALLALILLLPVVYLPRVLSGAAPEPLAPRPAWVQLVVVTASRWPDLDGAARHPAFDRLERRGTRARQAYTTTLVPAGAAASLWTGRWASAHGVLAPDRALAPGSWTMARAAREAGARTVAFLQEPFATATGIAGFEKVRESPDAAPSVLAADAATFLARHADERTLVWIHLADAGPGGADVGAVLDVLNTAREDPDDATGRRFDTLTLVTGFGTDVPDDGEPGGIGEPGEPGEPGEIGDLGDDRAYRTPLWAVLPAALYAGRSGEGSVSLVDVAGVLCELMRLPRPDESRGERPIQSYTLNLEHALKGGGGFEWLLLHERDREILRFGRMRVVATGEPPWEDREPRVDAAPDPTADRGFVPGPAGVRAEQIAQWRELSRQAREDAAESVPTEVPEAWRGRPGW